MSNVTDLWVIDNPPAPDPSGPICLVVIYRLSGLLMSLDGFEAQPDDPCIPWIGDNDNERPFAWRDRQPRF